jgi:hypothetical protein
MKPAACNFIDCKSAAEFRVTYPPESGWKYQIRRCAKHYGHHDFTERLVDGAWVPYRLAIVAEDEAYLAAKSLGQVAYERDVELDPLYPNGSPRKAWSELDNLSRWAWELNPTVLAKGRTA